MKKILISGYHGFDNCGDEAILLAMIKNFTSINKSLEIVALSKNPLDTTKKYGIKTINRLNIFSIFYHIMSSNMVISGGGSLLQDVTSTRSIIYYLSIIFLAKLLGKPVFVYANGIGPINKKFNRFLTTHIVNNVDIITLRDSDSKDELSRLNITKPQIIVTADPVFTLEPIKSEKDDSVFADHNIYVDKPLVGISIRDWKTRSDFENIIADVCDKVIEKYNCNILFIPMHMSKDLETIKKVQALMKNKSFKLSGNPSINDYMRVIGSLHLLISMRLHSLIFAAVENVPMIGIVYDPKVESFLELVSQPCAGKVDSFDEASVFKHLDYIFNNRNLICKKLNDDVQKLKNEALKNDQIIGNYLNK